MSDEQTGASPEEEDQEQEARPLAAVEPAEETDAQWTRAHPPASMRAYALARSERRRAVATPAAPAPARSPSALARSQESARRDENARRRDETARLRDVTARARDQAADARDRAAERKVNEMKRQGLTAEQIVRVFEERLQTLRARAKEDREDAAADRAKAAADRNEAALDRRYARIDTARAHLDDLTGVFRRGMGQETLEMEIERAHRVGEPLVLAFIDVDGLKAVNDEHGHAEGDSLLQAVAGAIEAQLRAHDPIMRMGGDEFVCAFPNTDLEGAATRTAEIQRVLTNSHPAGSISIGLALLEPGESLDDLIARGDAELYRIRNARQ